MKLSSALVCSFALHTAIFAHAESSTLPKGTTRVPVVFAGGHDTDPQDRGRPVVLVAGGLGVKPEVFREAFSNVHPAGPGSGGPTEAEARKNKQALMSVLGKYGITNERLDQVSNYYRYVKSNGEMWPTEPAVVNALVRNGTVIGYEVVSGGSGYSSIPTFTVPNVAAAPGTVELSFGKDLKHNGAISAIKLAPAVKK
jgi:hypothetical protein